MANKNFNPNDWIPKPETKDLDSLKPVSKITNEIEHDIEVIVRRVENYRLDLTLNYQDWLTIGFALAEFGETGRGWFHRISCFYPGYDFSKCDRQFDKCLKRNKRGVTIRSFFRIARDAGVNIRV